MQEIINAVVVDNEIGDIIGISAALASAGISTLPIHYRDSTQAKAHCKSSASASPRIIITDIQMQTGGNTPSRTDLANVAGCLAEIVGNTEGPYVVLAWTSKPESLISLQSTVRDYFQLKGIREALYFEGISKEECKDEDGYSATLILEKFASHLNGQAGLRALMSWEKAVLSAAHRTVNALLMIPEMTIEETLSALGEVSAGKTLRGNEFPAINDAIANILQDEIAQNSLKPPVNNIWPNAVRSLTKKVPDKAKHVLNTYLHFDQSPNVDIVCPGDVWTFANWSAVFNLFAYPAELPSMRNAFIESFVALDTQKVTSLTLYLARELTPAVRVAKQAELDTIQTAYEATLADSKLIGMEISPACDFSNGKKPIKTLVMGMLIPAKDLSKHVKLSATDDVSKSPITFNSQDYHLMVSAKYVISLSGRMLNRTGGRLDCRKEFRVRESMLLSWMQKISSYNSRIGTIEFHL